MIRALLVASLLVSSGCATALALLQNKKCPVNYADERYHATGTEITQYAVPSTLSKSPMGIPIGPGVDGAKVDAAFKTVSKCLGVEFNPCGVHAVIIAPDWFAVPGSEEQVFPCELPAVVNGGLCIGANQYPATIVLTPDMKAMAWEAERMLLKDDPNKDGGRNCWQRPEDQLACFPDDVEDV
jgi:hypothetical protein